MKNIGTYNGIDCYECTMGEWMNLYIQNKDKGKIFIIDGTMVKNNIIVGHYDGKSVVDDYKGVKYYNRQEKKSSSIVGDINFADYSKVVDEFFKKLGM